MSNQYKSTIITTILFDLSEVLLTGLKGTEERINEKLGTELKSPSLMSLPEAKQLFHGEITEKEYWNAVINTFHLNTTVSQLTQFIRENFKEIEGTRDIIERLRKNGYTLGLLSVHTKEWIEYCEKTFDFHKLFHSKLYSFEVAVSKPEKRAYQLLLEKLNVQAEECIFIDDSKANILAARELGIIALQFENAKQLEDDFKKLHIRLA